MTCNETCPCGRSCVHDADAEHEHLCMAEGCRKDRFGCMSCDWHGTRPQVVADACPECDAVAIQISGWGMLKPLPHQEKLGHHDADSMTESEFLASYKQRDYPRPSVTVDLLIFTILDTDLKVLLIKRGGHPYKDCWALPGGFADVGDGTKERQGESLDKSAARELGEECFGDAEGETKIIDKLLDDHRVHLEQLYTFGEPYRDPRCRVITVAYYALVPPDLVPLVQASSDAREAQFFSVAHEVPGLAVREGQTLAFDHDMILRVALDRIRGKIDYAPIAFNLLPQRFTVTELRAVHEAIKGTSYDPANFRRRFKRMQTDGIIREAPGKRLTGGKPAKVYEFVQAKRDAYDYVIG